MRLARRTGLPVAFLRWWLLPSPLRILGDTAAFIAATGLLGFARDHHVAWLSVSSDVVAFVFIVPVFIAGLQQIIRALVVDPLRGFLFRRNTGENVYFRDGRMHRRPRHRDVRRGK